MTITQTTVDTYKTEKSNYWTIARGVAIQISAGDVIAYKNNKDGMFYAVKVISKTLGSQEDVALTVKGVRFKFEGLQTVGGTNYANMQVGDIFCGGNSTGGHSSISVADNGICKNGKLSAMGTGVSGTPSACISYAEFFDHETLTIPGFIHNTTLDPTDDIEQITVLPDVPSSTGTIGYNNGTEAINKFTSLHGEPILNGIARQLAYNFRFSVI